MQATSEIHTDRGSQVSDYPVDILAFLYVRWQLEGRFFTFPDVLMPPLNEAQLDDEPRVLMPEFHGRTSRLAWRAVFLAIYASWYHRIASGLFPDLDSLDVRRTSESKYIFHRSIVRCRHGEQWHNSESFNADEAWYEGEVAFLRIEGLPIQPWHH